METKKLKLINENLYPIEANSIIAMLIKNNVNFFKLKHLSNWEANHSVNNEIIEQKISALDTEMYEAAKIIEQAKKNNSKVFINAFIELKVIGKDKTTKSL